MAAKTVVMVLDRDDPRRGEITMLGGTEEAARLAEDLLESGIETERIRIFDATELTMKVAHKPVVSLGEGPAVEQPSELPEDDGPAPYVADESPGEPAEEEPLVRNGVRFSSLFRSEDS